jgi:molybdenum cofactor cytidylyltransferase
MEISFPYAIDGIVLAAGLSKRMGVQKLSMMLGGKPLLEWAVRAALESSLNHVVLVTSPELHGMGRICRALRGSEKLRTVVNKNPESGMSSSMLTGLDHVDPASAGVMILLGDQPAVTASLIDELIGTFHRNPDRIVYPTIMGRRTTPAVIPCRFFNELRAVTGDVGARGVIECHGDLTLAVEMGNRYDDRDMDTPDDMAHMETHSPARTV